MDNYKVDAGIVESEQDWERLKDMLEDSGLEIADGSRMIILYDSKETCAYFTKRLLETGVAETSD